jgi:hypothetical protein
LRIAALLVTAGGIRFGWQISLAPEWFYRSGLWVLAIVFTARTLGDGRYERDEVGSDSG